MRILEILVRENATAGATSAGNIATVTSPHIAIGPDRFKKSFTGSPGVSGTKAPKFTLDDQDGNSVSLSDFSGQKILIWFYKVV